MQAIGFLEVILFILFLAILVFEFLERKYESKRWNLIIFLFSSVFLLIAMAFFSVDSFVFYFGITVVVITWIVSLFKLILMKTTIT